MRARARASRPVAGRARRHRHRRALERRRDPRHAHAADPRHGLVRLHVDAARIRRQGARALHGHRPADHDAPVLRLERALSAQPDARMATRDRAHQPAHLRGAGAAPDARRRGRPWRGMARLPRRRGLLRCDAGCRHARLPEGISLTSIFSEGEDMTETPPNPSPEGVPGAVTDPSRVLAEDLTYTGARGEAVNGYLARPAADGEHPGMIVIHEAGGLGEHIRDVVARFANIGYVTPGGDLYTREGGPPDTSDPQALFARLFSMSDETALGDLQGAADELRSGPEATGKVGCIGFCMGGRYALLFACASDRLDAAVDCWGGFIDKATMDQRSTPERPTPPLELAASLHCPLMAAIGAEDQNPSPALGEELRRRAAESGQEADVEVYGGAGHAFLPDYRPSDRPEAAARRGGARAALL